MLKSILALVVSFAACFGPAAAQDIGGHYLMEGTSTTGAYYSGSADITMTSESDCRIKFSDGFAGICLVKGVVFAVAFDVHGKLGLTVYDIASDGVMTGIFIDDFHGGKVGKETLTPKRQ